MPAAEDEPEQFEIALSGSALTPPQALVVVEWPLDNPPRDVGLDSNFAAEHGAVYYHRVDNSDPEAGFSIAHGTDLWILPSESLGDFRQKIQDSWDDRDAGSEMAFRRYNMEAPHFRERFHKYDERINNILHWRLTYGDDYAELTLFPGSDDEHAHQIYYQHSGLKLLDEVVDMGLHANMLGGLLGLFSM